MDLRAVQKWTVCATSRIHAIRHKDAFSYKVAGPTCCTGKILYESPLESKLPTGQCWYVICMRMIRFGGSTRISCDSAIIRNLSDMCICIWIISMCCVNETFTYSDVWYLFYCELCIRVLCVMFGFPHWASSSPPHSALSFVCRFPVVDRLTSPRPSNSSARHRKKKERVRLVVLWTSCIQK